MCCHLDHFSPLLSLWKFRSCYGWRNVTALVLIPEIYFRSSVFSPARKFSRIPYRCGLTLSFLQCCDPSYVMRTYCFVPPSYTRQVICLKILLLYLFPLYIEFMYYKVVNQRLLHFLLPCAVSPVVKALFRMISTYRFQYCLASSSR